MVVFRRHIAVYHVPKDYRKQEYEIKRHSAYAKETLPVLVEALHLFRLIIYQMNVGVNSMPNAWAMRKKLDNCISASPFSTRAI